MTSWDDEPIGPALRVVARSTADGVRVEWRDTLAPGELPDACDGLAAFVATVERGDLGAAPARSLPAAHPHAGELDVPGHADEHRFLDVVLTRHAPSAGAYVEPSADDRSRGAAVAEAAAAWITPTGASYVPDRFSFGPGGPGAGDGPALPLAALAAAMRDELDRRRPR